MADAKTALIALGGTPDSGGDGLPNIPAVPATDNSALNNILSSMKLWMEKAGGQGLSSFAKKSEMVQAGVMAPADGGAVVKPVVGNMATPPVPKGLSATGAMTNIFLTWDNPADSYSNHAYTEIWASETDSFTNAVMVGQSAGFVFAHSVGEGSTRNYWIRFVSTEGVAGPFNSVGGKQGKTAQNPAYLMDVLTDEYGVTSESPFFHLDYPQTINGVTVPAGTYMKTAFIHDAAITNAMIGSLAADKITTGLLAADRIGANSITANKINGTNLSVVNGTFSGSLQAATGTFSGSLAAATGTFGGSLLAGVLDMSSFAGESHIFDKPGTYYLTVPSGKTSVRVTLVGAGGGGGGGGARSLTYLISGGGGGGGGGGTVVSGTYTLTAWSVITIVVGGGGAGGAPMYFGGGHGGVGGATTVSGSIYLSASGGVGGIGGSTNGYYTDGNDWFCYGGAGGSIGGAAGTVGNSGMVPSPYVKGGKGGAGGSTPYGSGGAGSNGGTRDIPPGYGLGGTKGGGGGGGGGQYARDENWYNNSGGAGGNGFAIVEFYNANSVVLMDTFQNFLVKYNALANAVGRSDLGFVS